VLLKRFVAPVSFILLLAFAYVSVAHNILPRAVQDVLFFVVLLLELGLIAAGWRFYVKNRKKAEIVAWRKWMSLIGVIANTGAIAVPFASIVYMIVYPWVGLRMNLPMIDADIMVNANLICSLCGVIAGILSPPRSRFAITLGSLIIALLVVSIPMGVL
jgi:hypothetical protein